MTTTNRISIGGGAKLVHKSRRYLRDLIDAGKLRAWQVGGSEEEPWLEVDPGELKRVVEQEQVYQPKGITPPRRRPARAQPHPNLQQLDPALQGLLKRVARSG